MKAICSFCSYLQYTYYAACNTPCSKLHKKCPSQGPPGRQPSLVAHFWHKFRGWPAPRGWGYKRAKIQPQPD